MYKAFIVFSSADRVLFHRSDAERAEWCHEEFSLDMTFPYDPEKVLERGMRIGFTDALGKFQLFEIRKAQSVEPDHIQEITAEHIVISELTDRHLVAYQPSTKVNAQTVVSALLSGTGWSIGTCTSTTQNKPDLTMINVWSALTQVRDGYGLRLEPYVTVNSTGITGRYIDVVDNEGVWRGVRLSVNKNIDTVGVTYDDTTLVTAVYGYGSKLTEEYEIPIDPYAQSGSSSSASQSAAPTPPDYGADYVTIKNVVWSQTADHPAKPAGQMYLEDPEATALYGRNGTPRFGYYSNSACDNANELIDLCWQALKNQSKPKISINCKLSQLYSLGYQGEQLQIGDTVRVEVEPIGTVIDLMCICLTENLLDPTKTRATIGKYIKDIIYIAREKIRDATGGSSGGGGGGGGGGGPGSDQIEQEKSVYTNFERTDEYILLQAVKIEETEEALTTAFTEIYMNAEEISLEASRAIGEEQNLDAKITINAEAITSEVTRATTAEGTLSSRITQTATDITSEVTRATNAETAIGSRITQTAESLQSQITGIDGQVSTITQTVNGITLQGDVITIKGNSVDLGDYVTVTSLQANYLSTSQLAAATISVGGINASADVDAQGVRAGSGLFNTLSVGNNSVTLHGLTVGNISMQYFGISDYTVAATDIPHSHAITMSESGGTVTATIGAVQTTQGTASFSIAATQFYQDAVAAAWDSGAATGTLNAPNSKTLSYDESITVFAYGTDSSGNTVNYGSRTYVAPSDSSSGVTVSVGRSDYGMSGSATVYMSVYASGSNGASDSHTYYMSIANELSAARSDGASGVSVSSWGSPTWNAGGVTVSCTLSNGNSYNHYYAE